MIGPMIPPPPEDDFLLGNPTDAEAVWRERERRQRSVRFLMMFLLMLLLMDGEEQQARQRARDASMLRKKIKAGKNGATINPNLYRDRRDLDRRIHNLSRDHSRYKDLVEKNEGRDFDLEIEKWADQQVDLEKDEFTPSEGSQNEDPETDKQKVFHYPWNTTGFYRGDWTIVSQNKAVEESATDMPSRTVQPHRHTTPKNSIVLPKDVEAPMLSDSRNHGGPGVYLLPPLTEFEVMNVTGHLDEDSTSKLVGRTRQQKSALLRGNSNPDIKPIQADESRPLQVTLTKDSGRAAFQLYSRSVPSMREISLIDGFVKLYDSNTIGYSTRRDLLLRVNGVFLHSIGKISLVANVSPGRSAFVVDRSPNTESKQRRRLEELIESGIATDQVAEVTSLLQSVAATSTSHGEAAVVTSLLTPDFTTKEDQATSQSPVIKKSRRLPELPSDPLVSETTAASTTVSAGTSRNQSDVLVPFPYVPDDPNNSIRRSKLPTRMPAREQQLEQNAGSCEFQINLNVDPVEWTGGEWRKLMNRRAKEIYNQDPSRQKGATSSNNNDDRSKAVPGLRKKAKTSVLKDQALVMAISGSIASPNCNFSANVNATAIRTDWEHTGSKAINYSFYMMLTCLTQIVVLLRQILHTQAQSAAARVSLLSIGWQTVLDALHCLIHIYLSLSMQPLFTAFASVAFFKLLIFCVIEMKYMAIIIQARNSSNGGNNAELFRRQVAMLHLRFYVALMAVFLAFFYIGERYRTVYMLFLYSFWVPQIIHNVVTEAKRPLHPYFIYGISLTRLVAPVYIFAVPKNFLQEVYPDSPHSVFMCQLLVLWVAFQAAILVAQSKYGARFFIPARFLPPKFDYNRPIPPSLLPPGGLGESPTDALKSERGVLEIQPLVPKEERRSSALKSSTGARNRIKGKRATRTESGMTEEPVTHVPARPSTPKFECVICYNDIDVRNRSGYMLAPCNHLFHKDCLVQWMDVKMECPICRSQLPSL